MRHGASASAYVTHGVLSGRRGGAHRVLADRDGSDHYGPSILATEAVRNAPNIRELTIAPLLAEAMRRISEESSVSSLFD